MEPPPSLKHPPPTPPPTVNELHSQHPVAGAPQVHRWYRHAPPHAARAAGQVGCAARRVGRLVQKIELWVWVWVGEKDWAKGVWVASPDTHPTRAPRSHAIKPQRPPAPDPTHPAAGSRGSRPPATGSQSRGPAAWRPAMTGGWCCCQTTEGGRGSIPCPVMRQELSGLWAWQAPPEQPTHPPSSHLHQNINGSQVNG